MKVEGVALTAHRPCDESLARYHGTGPYQLRPLLLLVVRIIMCKNYDRFANLAANTSAMARTNDDFD